MVFAYVDLERLLHCAGDDCCANRNAHLASVAFTNGNYPPNPFTNIHTTPDWGG